MFHSSGVFRVSYLYWSIAYLRATGFPLSLPECKAWCWKWYVPQGLNPNIPCLQCLLMFFLGTTQWLLIVTWTRNLCFKCKVQEWVDSAALKQLAMIWIKHALSRLSASMKCIESISGYIVKCGTYTVHGIPRWAKLLHTPNKKKLRGRLKFLPMNLPLLSWL